MALGHLEKEKWEHKKQFNSAHWSKEFCLAPVLDEISHAPAGDLYFIASLKMLRPGEYHLPSESGRTDIVKMSSDIKKKKKIRREKDT